MEGTQTMTRWVSRFGAKFWAWTGLCVLFAGFIVLVAWTNGPALLITFLSVVVLLFIGLVFYRFPVVVLDADGVRLRRCWWGKLITWNDIADIRLLDSVPIPLSYYNDQGATLVLKNGRTVGIAANFTNMYALRQLLFIANLIRKEGGAPESVFDRWAQYSFPVFQKNTEDVNGMEDMERFSESPFSSILVIALLIVLVLFISIGWLTAGSGSFPIMLGVLAVIMVAGFILSSIDMYAFRMNDRFLIVYNQFLPLGKKVYSWDQVSFAFIHGRYKRPTQFILVTKDYRTFSYGASSLWTKDWSKLKQGLRTRGIGCMED